MQNGKRLSPGCRLGLFCTQLPPPPLNESHGVSSGGNLYSFEFSVVVLSSAHSMDDYLFAAIDLLHISSAIMTAGPYTTKLAIPPRFFVGQLQHVGCGCNALTTLMQKVINAH